MKTVFKYPVNISGQVQAFSMPEGAQLLSLQLQRGRPTLWALVDPAAPMGMRRFVFVGTGDNAVGAGMEYVETLQFNDGNLVLHLFEVLGG